MFVNRYCEEMYISEEAVLLTDIEAMIEAAAERMETSIETSLNDLPASSDATQRNKYAFRSKAESRAFARRFANLESSPQPNFSKFFVLALGLSMRR
jgi:hypothetical protein